VASGAFPGAGALKTAACNVPLRRSRSGAFQWWTETRSRDRLSLPPDPAQRPTESNVWIFALPSTILSRKAERSSNGSALRKETRSVALTFNILEVRLYSLDKEVRARSQSLGLARRHTVA
jgi:hypothetical protein